MPDILAIQVRAAFFLGDIIDRLKPLVFPRRVDRDDRVPPLSRTDPRVGVGVGSAEAGARSTLGAIARAILFFVWPR
jgi:hypothetical protein